MIAINKKLQLKVQGMLRYAMAADIALGGFDVNLYEMPYFAKNIETLMSDSRINLVEALQGFVTLNKVANIY